MPQVIEWTGAGPDDIVWRYPAEDIQWGAQLVVHEYETAVFFRDGKSYDSFGPGRHTLTTLNLSKLTAAFSRLAGFTQTPFKAAVIFIATKQFEGKFGTKAQTTELAPLMTFGSFWVKVETPELFVNEVLGGQNAYTTPSVNDFLRGFINERMIDVLSKYDLITVFTKLDETSDQVKASLVEYFRRIGLQLIDLKFEGIDTAPEYRDRLFWLKQGGMTPEGVLRMETVKEAAKELGKSSGAALGTGMVLMPPLFQTSVPGAPAMVLVVCPSCNAQIPSTSKFCPNCGKSISAMPQPPSQVPSQKCAKCGEILPTGAQFCQNCGTKV
jgi:membrane protease subunit (stomatin/prohibitin family)